MRKYFIYISSSIELVFIYCCRHFAIPSHAFQKFEEFVDTTVGRLLRDDKKSKQRFFFSNNTLNK